MEFLIDIENAFLPEVVILISIFVLLILSMIVPKRMFKISKWVAVAGILTSLSASYLIQIAPNYYAFKNAFLTNGFTVFFENLILISTFIIVLLSRNYVRQIKNRSFEYFALILSATLASMCLVSSNDFLSMFVSLEFLSACCYLLCAFSRNKLAKEAGLKYLIIGSVASAVMLLGVSYLYGVSGSFNFNSINDYFMQYHAGVIFTLGTILTLAGLTFKIGVFPFANWVADVYEGSSYPVGAYLSMIPKIAGFGFLARLLVFVFTFSSAIKLFLALIAVITIFYATYAAIRQSNIKRFLGYSSVAQSGFLVLGLATISVYGFSSVLFYIFCYIFMNLGVWAAVILFHNSCGKDDIASYKGLAYEHPFYVLAFSFCLISLAGLPPTAGFLAKLYLFSSVARAEYIFLPFLFATLLLTVLGVYFYLKPVKIMFEKNDKAVQIDNHLISTKSVLYTCTLVTFVLCFFSDKIIQLCQIMAYYI